MKNTPAFYGQTSWTAGQKTAFRFCFVFFTLQVLTENFLGNWFGSTLFIWRLGEKIFVRPCLWLNHQLFHFKYIPPAWTSFSGSLHTIRDTVYLLLSCVACVLWTMLDKKRTNYNKLNYWFSRCLVIALSCILFTYGVVKVLPVQMASPSFIGLQVPVGDLSPFNLLWTTFGYGKPYQVFTGVFELSAAILVLFKRTRMAGLLIAISVMLNVVVINYTYQVGVLILSVYILLIALFLLAPYAGRLCRFFFTLQPVIIPEKDYVPAKNTRTRLFAIISTLLLASSFALTSWSAYDRYTTAAGINHSRQYSLVRNYIVNNDTVKLAANDTLCWRIWSERVVDGKRLVSIAPVKPGAFKTYAIAWDTAKHALTLHPLNQPDTAPLNFSYTDINKVYWRLNGTIKGKNTSIELQKINPDTTLHLLKIKRAIIVFDDELDNQ